MIFHKNKDTIVIPNVSMHCNGDELGRVSEFKYLGILLDPSHTFAKHLKTLESKTAHACGRKNGFKRKLTK
jgi:hypothetical protein